MAVALLWVIVDIFRRFLNCKFKINCKLPGPRVAVLVIVINSYEKCVWQDLFHYSYSPTYRVPRKLIFVMQHYFNPAKTARPNRWYAPVSTSQRIFGKSEYLDVLIIKIKKRQDSMVCLEIQARIKNRKKHQARSRREF